MRVVLSARPKEWMASKFVQALIDEVKDLSNVQQVSLILLQYCLHLSKKDSDLVLLTIATAHEQSVQGMSYTPFSGLACY